MEIGGSIEFVKDKEVECLREDQTTYIYENVELQDIVKMNTNKQDTDKKTSNRI